MADKDYMTDLVYADKAGLRLFRKFQLVAKMLAKIEEKNKQRQTPCAKEYIVVYSNERAKWYIVSRTNVSDFYDANVNADISDDEILAMTGVHYLPDINTLRFRNYNFL